ncbi:hypothetical protein OIU77_017642 [Salix suchowensis]|uniref:Uncharacterized protein n=1 Tax=Salix suchowensis TaxID=1278906 RepID=A0ABQ8ZQ22_9ROSI|nr:hypothetical protein OIU77_017642 [Salix suchowensis]
MGIPCSLDSSYFTMMSFEQQHKQKENMHGWWWLTLFDVRLMVPLFGKVHVYFPSLQCPFAFYFLGF